MKLDYLARFEQIAEHSREEQPPLIDVSATVVQTLSRPVVLRPDERELLWCGAVSCVAACLALLLLWPSLPDDSLLLLAQPFFHQVEL